MLIRILMMAAFLGLAACNGAAVPDNPATANHSEGGGGGGGGGY